MPLYLKLYFYFVTLIVMLFLLLPVIVIRSVGKQGEMKPPHIRLIETIHKTVEHVRQSTSDNDTLARELEKLADRKDIQLALYDSEGKALVWTGRHDDLDRTMLLRLKRDRFYSDDPGPGRALQMVIPLDCPRFAYLSVVDTMRRHHFPPGLFDRLLIMCLISFVLIYPLALHFTRPLERITGKAIRFTAGDFGDIGNSVSMKGNDEISRLDRAFDHMARGFVSMIESKKELLSDISHELGSPLSRMQVAVDIMEKQREKGEQPSPRTLGILSRNIDAMSKIVKELLELSRANKTYALNLEKVNIEEIASALVQDYQDIMKRTNLNARIHREGEMSPMSVDRAKLITIMGNLLSNSIEYSPENGQIDIYIECKDGHFTFSLQDMGPGISAENGEKVFEPLFREDPSRTRKTGGVGLGLAIVKKFVSLHGGDIRVENPGEKGARFTFRI